MYVARITIFDLINNQAILKVFNTLKYHFAKKKNFAEYHRQRRMQHVKAGTDCILLTEKHTSVSKMKEEGLIFSKKNSKFYGKV